MRFSIDDTTRILKSVLQRVAMCCSLLQCVAVCCRLLQCVAVCYIMQYACRYSQKSAVVCILESQMLKSQS